MVRAWRIITAPFARVAFTGEYTAEHPGRWNAFGTRIVYTAASPSLALLEVLAHRHDDPGIDPMSLPIDYVVIPVDFEDACVADLPSLPVDWNVRNPIPESTRDLGSRWAAAMTSLVLRVPSICMPIESNYLLNPLHPDFLRLTIGTPQPLQLDPRLLGNGTP